MIDFDRLKGWLLGLIACAIITLLVGCKTTKYVPVEKVRTEYKDRIVAVHDTIRDSVKTERSVYQKDSMAVSRKGDTVMVDRWHTLRMIYYEKAKNVKVLSRADSTSTAKVDSVQVPVERKSSRWKMLWQKGKDMFAIIGIIAVGIFAVIVYKRLKR
jgi:hypothetical protein